VIETEPGMAVGASEFVPEWPDDSAPVVVMVGADRKTEPAPGGPVLTLLGHGRKVVLADLRGMNETEKRVRSDRNASPLGLDAKEAFLSLHIGRPLLGQRVLDLLTLLESMETGPERRNSAGFELVGTGPAGLAVLHAAALEGRGLIRGITLQHTLISWADVVQRGESQQQLASVVPGVLRYYDLPDLAARLEPCPLVLDSPVDALGREVSQSELEAVYAACVRSYGAGGPLVLKVGP
jgi:hypothetical protein